MNENQCIMWSWAEAWLKSSLVFDDKFKILGPISGKSEPHDSWVGGHGAVFHACEREYGADSREVALKIVNINHVFGGNEAGSNLKQSLRSLREANIAYEAKSDYILFPLQTGEGVDFVNPQNVVTWFSYQYFEDATPLNKFFVDATPVPFVRVFIKACEAIMKMHDQGKKHGDIKPSNILVVNRTTDNPSPKVIDFGIASDIYSAFPEFTCRRSDYWASPEQKKGDEPSVMSDSFSLGKVLKCYMEQIPNQPDEVDWLNWLVDIASEERPLKRMCVEELHRRLVDWCFFQETKIYDIELDTTSSPNLFGAKRYDHDLTGYVQHLILSCKEREALNKAEGIASYYKYKHDNCKEEDAEQYSLRFSNSRKVLAECNARIGEHEKAVAIYDELVEEKETTGYPQDCPELAKLRIKRHCLPLYWINNIDFCYSCEIPQKLVKVSARCNPMGLSSILNKFKEVLDDQTTIEGTLNLGKSLLLQEDFVQAKDQFELVLEKYTLITLAEESDRNRNHTDIQFCDPHNKIRHYLSVRIPLAVCEAKLGNHRSAENHISCIKMDVIVHGGMYKDNWNHQISKTHKFIVEYATG